MTDTLQVMETIQRTGYTVIDGVKIVQHTCTISSDEPTKMRVGMIKLDADLYGANRSICRDDFAVFEDAAYELQAKLIAEVESKNTSEM